MKIIELRLEDLRRMLANRQISLELTDAAKELLLAEGYDVNYGAGRLNGLSSGFIQDPLALKILDGEIWHGDHVLVNADPAQHRMTFTVATRVGAETASRR